MKLIPKKPPIGIDALIKEALDTQEELSENLQLSVFIDDTAPGDLISLVRSAFAEASANVRITISYVGTAHAIPDPEDDMSVIVAGNSAKVAELFQANRNAGVPCLVVTMNTDTLALPHRNDSAHIDAGDIVSVGKKDAEPLSKAESQEVLDGMGKWICSTCQDKSLSFARSFAFTRRPLSIDCVNMTSLENCMIGVFFRKPGTNLPIMTMNQMKMMLQIAAAYNQPLNADRVPELAAVLAAAYCGRGFSFKICNDIPVLSIAARGAVAYATTLCIGRTAVLYFENGGGIGGLAKAINDARETLFSHLSLPKSASAAEEVKQAESADGQPLQKIASLKNQAVSIGTAIGSTASPLVKSAALFGVNSFKNSVKGLVK